MGVQLSYAIGVAKPLSLFVETYGTEQGALTATDITNIVKINFDCRPGAIAQSLALREPKYQETAAYGHFGREPYTKNGIKFFEWESAKDLRKYTGMSSADVTAELTASNFLRSGSTEQHWPSEGGSGRHKICGDERRLALLFLGSRMALRPGPSDPLACSQGR